MHGQLRSTVPSQPSEELSPDPHEQLGAPAVEALLRIIRRLSATFDVDELLDRLVSEAMTLVGAESGFAGRITPAGLQCFCWHRKGEVLPFKHCFSPGQGLPGWLLLHKRPYVNNKPATDAQTIPEFRKMFEMRSVLSTPILDRNDDVVAFVQIHNKGDGSPFSMADQLIMTLLAQGASLAIENAVTYKARLQLAAIVDTSDDAIIGKDLEGVVTSWNAAATRVFGYTAEELIGSSILKLIPPELYSEEPEILRRLRAGERIDHYETRRVRKNGEFLDVSLTISPIKDALGKIIGVSKIARDITERKRAEAALVQSEKLAATGRMAAAIAHEVNNPLEAILNLSYLIAKHPSLDEEARQYSELLLDEVVRVSRITKQMLSFYREISDPAEMRIDEVLDSVLRLHRPIFQQKSIGLVTEYRSSATVLGRTGELRQVFTNLIINAIDALEPGGELKIKVQTSQATRTVRISFADNGSGVPAGARQKLFDPFFSTKHGRGTGLGLWVSDGIIRKHGGTIRMRTSTAPGRSGTVFTISLPLQTA
jgi:PAS domain S-box-containing protein